MFYFILIIFLSFHQKVVVSQTPTPVPSPVCVSNDCTAIGGFCQPTGSLCNGGFSMKNGCGNLTTACDCCILPISPTPSQVPTTTIPTPIPTPICRKFCTLTDETNFVLCSEVFIEDCIFCTDNSNCGGICFSGNCFSGPFEGRSCIGDDECFRGACDIQICTTPTTTIIPTPSQIPTTTIPTPIPTPICQTFCLQTKFSFDCEDHKEDCFSCDSGFDCVGDCISNKCDGGPANGTLCIGSSDCTRGPCNIQICTTTTPSQVPTTTITSPTPSPTPTSICGNVQGICRLKDSFGADINCRIDSDCQGNCNVDIGQGEFVCDNDFTLLCTSDIDCNVGPCICPCGNVCNLTSFLPISSDNTCTNDSDCQLICLPISPPLVLFPVCNISSVVPLLCDSDLDCNLGSCINTCDTPPSLGACCIGGICFDNFTIQICSHFNGIYQGDNSTCETVGECPTPTPTPTPTPPTSDCYNILGYFPDDANCTGGVLFQKDITTCNECVKLALPAADFSVIKECSSNNIQMFFEDTCFFFFGNFTIGQCFFVQATGSNFQFSNIQCPSLTTTLPTPTPTCQIVCDLERNFPCNNNANCTSDCIDDPNKPATGPICVSGPRQGIGCNTLNPDCDAGPCINTCDRVTTTRTPTPTPSPPTPTPTPLQCTIEEEFYKKCLCMGEKINSTVFNCDECFLSKSTTHRKLDCNTLILNDYGTDDNCTIIDEEIAKLPFPVCNEISKNCINDDDNDDDDDDNDDDSFNLNDLIKTSVGAINFSDDNNNDNNNDDDDDDDDDEVKSVRYIVDCPSKTQLGNSPKSNNPKTENNSISIYSNVLKLIVLLFF